MASPTKEQKQVTPDTAFIVGAGFSHYAGLPLQAEFAAKLLRAAQFKKAGPSKALVDYINNFVKEAFGHPAPSAEAWPELEDIFTCIDLSANSGHHLGRRYSPATLRTVRRALISRLIRMLDQEYRVSRTAGDVEMQQWRSQGRFLSRLDLRKAHFISMNWDSSMESRLPDHPPDYGSGIEPAEPPEIGRHAVRPRAIAGASRLNITKIHGSVNWLYCDSCRSTFWFDPAHTSRIARQIVTTKDSIPGMRRYDPWQCRRCRVDLSTRLATFSYRKALDFPMFVQSWLRASCVLSASARWVFIGYSLPAADFEFKHLLMMSQLGPRHRPAIFVITGGDSQGVARTKENFRKFFGDGVRAGRFFGSGLSAATTDALESEGIPMRAHQ